MRPLSDEEVRNGKVACRLWQYIGITTVAPIHITDSSLLRALTGSIKPSERNLAVSHVISVLIASQAINKMMGKPERAGMYLGLLK